MYNNIGKTSFDFPRSLISVRNKGDFWRFPDFKRGKCSFYSPSPPCNVVPLFELPQENNKNPSIEWRGQGRDVDSFVLWSPPYLNNMSQQFCRRLWGLILVDILSGRVREIRPYRIPTSHPSLDIINILKSLAAIETIGTSTAFEPLASALPLQCSTNWAMKTQHWDLQGSI